MALASWLLAVALLATKLRPSAGTHTAYGQASFKLTKHACNVTGAFFSDYYAGRSGDGRVLECMSKCFDEINIDHTPFKMNVRAREHEIPGEDQYDIRSYKAGVTGERLRLKEKVLFKKGNYVCNW